MTVPVDTKPLPVQAPPRRHRLRNGLIAAAVVLVLLVVALVVGDGVFRGYAEGQIDRTVASSLPKGVTGTIHSKIGGFSALQQWSRGRFDDVTITSDDLRINGGAASAKVHVHGLPVDGTGTVREASGTLTISQAALAKLAPLAGADASAPKLGSDTVSTSIKRTILGVPITVDVTLVPSVRGEYVRLNPTKAQLRSGPISVPGTTLIRTLLPNGISVCAAKYLPPQVRLTDLQVSTGHATLAFTADHLRLDALQSGATGSC